MLRRSIENKITIKSLVKGILPKPRIEKEWFPTEENHLDLIGKNLIKLEESLNPDHPGFTDLGYKERRRLIGEISKTHKMKKPIKKITYSNEETQLWGYLFNQLTPKLMQLGCVQYKKNFKKLEKEGLFTNKSIPQLEDLSNFLKTETNWRIKPVSGILSQREFLNCLAFRTFCSTQYIRHPSIPEYTPEPDIMHEFMGHIPMFLDPKICRISQIMGILSLGASEEEISKLAAFYWYTIEFGLCWENGKKKFFGAGVTGSLKELDYLEKCKNLIKMDLINNPPKAEPVLQDLQPFYYIAESFDSVLEQMEEFYEKWEGDKFVEYDMEKNRFNVDSSVFIKERLGEKS